MNYIKENLLIGRTVFTSLMFLRSNSSPIIV